MNRPRVLLIESMYDKAGEDLLAAHTDLRVVSAAGRDGIHEAIRTASAVWVRYPARLTREAIHEWHRLLIISTSGRGRGSHWSGSRWSESRLKRVASEASRVGAGRV